MDLTELGGSAVAVANEPKIRWTMFVEAEVVLICRKVPKEVLDAVGFFEWNRFCDRLDKGLKPLRKLNFFNKKNECCGQSEENSAKATALEAIQVTCDKLSQRYPYLQFSLFFPFHSRLTENWHIQATATALPSNAEAGAPLQQDNTETEETARSDTVSDEGEASLPLPVSDSASDGTSTNDSRATELDDDPNNDNPLALQPQKPISERASFLRSSGLGVLGVDYIEHELQPSDTLNGLCLAYNIAPSRLKHANLLSGENDSLVLAPKILAIPITDGFYSRVPDTESEDYKLNALKRQVPKIGTKEAKAYLELSDWVLEDALAMAKEDIEWEKGNNDDLF
ncbi:expressed unknown protein [Seminavis robusta]|uniref:LysM domain-containing protein n=1 Tax=Seminavis robusta TaxID=568900 RepID=A0A9N8H4F4_9STRA|nr:expressed unknown protein [Seminavis robusta]|eukprot:Sro61_g035050.1 n/a (340) ;mRNA; r:78411-79612